MHSSIITACLALIFLGTTTATPNGIHEVRTLKLFNGEKTVDAINSGVDSRSYSENPAIAIRQSQIDCKGSAFCERLGGSCDDALRKVIPGNEYSTYDGSQNTGTCSGTCGLFFSGDHCEGTGQELIDAYNAIRNIGHCSHCGRWKRDSDGCLIKIDRVMGC